MEVRDRSEDKSVLRVAAEWRCSGGQGQREAGGPGLSPAWDPWERERWDAVGGLGRSPQR